MTSTERPMSDIKTIFRDFGGDWETLAPGLAEDDGLETAVAISLFTDRRAEPDDALPAGDDRRGWWGDALAEVEGDRIGSRLWLLSREKQLVRVLPKAREYALEALQWLIEDGVALAVDVAAEIVAPGALGLLVEIRRPAGAPVKYRFERFWNPA
jgi:phage gp46-like protein